MLSLCSLIHTGLEMGTSEQSRAEGKEDLGSRLDPVNTWGTRANSKREASHASDA